MQPRTSLSLRRAPCLLAEYGKAHWYNPFSARSNDQRYDRGVLINQSPGLSNDDVEPCFFWVVFSKSTAAPQSTEHMVLFHRWRWPWWPPPNALRNKWPKRSKPARCSSCLQKGKRNRHCLAIVSSLSSLPGLVGTGLSSFMPEFFHVKNYGLPRSIDVLEDRVHAFGMFALNLCGGLRFTTTGTKTKEV